MRALICGYGRMGKLIGSMLKDEGWEVFISDMLDSSFLRGNERVDVVFDFSSPSFTISCCEYVKRTGCALVCGTTGLDAPQRECLKETAENAPICVSSNFSLGIAALASALEAIGGALENFDIEILEKHHNQKSDSPSGTALYLADVIDKSSRRNHERIYARSGAVGPRGNNEMGIFALRGGSVSGEHTVYYFGQDETLEFTHRATSRTIFAHGAINAAKRLIGKAPGSYEFRALMFGGNE